MEYSRGVIIVGGGIMGSCAAYELAKRGFEVILLEKFDFLHQLGSSHGESRAIRMTYPKGHYSGMAVESARLWEEAELEIGYRVYTKTPQFDISPQANRRLQSVIANCISNSIPHSILDRRQVSEKFRGIFDIPDGWIGLSTEIGGIIRATKAVSMFQTLAIRHGSCLMDHMEVVQIMKDVETGLIRVYTACGNIFSGCKCVVTVGAWMRKLVKGVTGVELPIQPLDSTVCYWKIKEGSEDYFSQESGFPMFESYGDPYIYGTPSLEYPGLIKIAVHGGYPCDPDHRTWAKDMVLLRQVLSPWIKRRFGDRVDSRKPAFTQSCIYSMTPDSDFVIDFLGGEFGQDVVIAGGFLRPWVQNGPSCGEDCGRYGPQWGSTRGGPHSLQVGEV